VREEHKFRVFESRVLRVIFGFWKEEGKVVPAHAIEAYGGGGILHLFLTSTIDGGDRVM
jgi:hypothetical protein